MPINDGTLTRIYNWQDDEANNVPIDASRMDGEFNNLVEGVNVMLPRDGSAPATNDLPMAGHKITNLGDPVADTDAMNARTADQRYGTSTAVRLTLASGVPVTESDVVGAGTIYLTPDGSNTAGIYSGSAWVARPFTETALQLDAAGHVANSNYDIFAYWDGSAVKIGSAPAWAGNTLRGIGANTSELEFFQGRLVNKNSCIVRNAGATVATIPARRGLLVGGFRVGSIAGQTEDSLARRFLSNVYGRTTRQMERIDPANTWTYSAATWRQAHGEPLNKLEWFSCVGGDPISVTVFASASNSTSTPRGATVGIGIDQITVNDARFKRVLSVDQLVSGLDAIWNGAPGIGYHYAAWLEYSGATDTRTFYGTSTSIENQSGIFGTVVA